MSYIRFDSGSGWTGSETNHDVYYGSPSYYAQCMFAGNVGTEVVETVSDSVPRMQVEDATVDQFYCVATRDKAAHKLYPKMPTFVSDVRRSLNTDAADSIYDLTGRRLNGIPSSGFYVRGGKKFFVR